MTRDTVPTKRGYSEEEAAEYLGISIASLRKARTQKPPLIGVKYFGSKPVYDVHELNRLYDSLPSEKEKN